jgi:hypothetical protein
LRGAYKTSVSVPDEQAPDAALANYSWEAPTLQHLEWLLLPISYKALHNASEQLAHALPLVNP